MRIVADLHLHSKYSRAVSQKMEPKTMAQWAAKKGIDLIATGDWTHPLWLKELESNLEEAGEGIYKLKNQNSLAAAGQANVKTTSQKSKLIEKTKDPAFILSTEISSIYSQGGKVRRIHNLIIAPSFKVVHKINDELKRRGCNLMSDGRPIIGLSANLLAGLVWSVDENCLIIPCHVWTPWFSLYGSKSGFDSIEECFGQFADKIFAIETGLSSSPDMNWRIKDLDTRSIVSFGDCHSPAKLGREVTVFEVEELSFANLASSLSSRTKFESVFESRAKKLDQSPSSSVRDAVNAKTLLNLSSRRELNRILYTLEFYPEEGKYHYTGHRNCGIKQSPEETKKKGAQCPVCGRPLTLGVMHRVEQLASRPAITPLQKVNPSGLVGYYNPQDSQRPPYVMLVPLMEILAESLCVGVISQKVINEYEKLTNSLGSELDILTQIKVDEITKAAGEKVAEGINKVRSGMIVIDPGYDGVFGVVKIWSKQTEEKIAEKKEQITLF